MRIEKIIVILLLTLNSNIFSQKLDFIERDSLKEVNGFFLEDTYKNPYGAVNYIEFNIPFECSVKVFITEVKSLNDDKKNFYTDTLLVLYQGLLSKGFYRLNWNARDKNNNPVKNGFYDYFLSASFGDNSYKMNFQGRTRFIVLR